MVAPCTTVIFIQTYSLQVKIFYRAESSDSVTTDTDEMYSKSEILGCGLITQGGCNRFTGAVSLCRFLVPFSGGGKF